MRGTKKYGAGCSIAVALALLGCQPVIDADKYDVREVEARDAFDAARVALSGRVVDDLGRALPGAQVTLSGGGQAEATAVTDADGVFTFVGLSRRNRLVSVSIEDRHPAVAVALLAVPIDVPEVSLETFVLNERQPGATRFLFGGDVALGRRFLDPDSETPVDQVPPPNPDAMISTGDPGPGSAAVFEHVAPLFATADYPIVNLETPVTRQPATPHPTKDFVFFTLPESLPALIDAGVRYVSLGNNHTFDYLEGGIVDTISTLDEVGLPHSGAGLDSAAAFAPYDVELGGSTYSLVSATSVVGSQHAVNYVAEASKGGAADLRDMTSLETVVEDSFRAGSVPILQLHVGIEYAQRPSTGPDSWFGQALATGARLIIGHHPHVAQGVSYADGDLVFYSLGNFAFDQERLETLLGLAAVVDMQEGAPVGAYGVPVYLEDFRPRLIGGVLYARELRRLGELSEGVVMYPFGGRGWIDLANEAAAVDRVVTVPVSIDDRGVGVVDLRAVLAPTESIASVVGDSEVSLVQIGRDLMKFGDAEDYDADADFAEAARWDVSSGSLRVCLQDSYRGVAAFCSVRDSLNSSDSVLPFRNRIRVLGDAEGTPNKDLTLFGYIRRDNAGDVSIVTRYFASSGEAIFGEETAFEMPAGSSDWTPFFAELNMPGDQRQAPPTSPTSHARAVRPFLRHSPPRSGVGQVIYDDLAIISWDPGDAAGEALSTPNDAEFLRVYGRPGDRSVELRLRRFLPVAAAFE